MAVTFQGARPKEAPSRVLLRLAVYGVLVLGLGGALTGVIAYGVMAQGLPAFRTLADYRPKLVTRVFGQEGQLIGEFFRERREVVPYRDLPPRIVQAFLASEDDRFFDHEGIDYWGIVRAAIANLRAGRVVQGGSTVTQQVAKSLIISSEGYRAGTARKLSRKVREAILARRLERNLSKEDILTLYLNQIFLGNQAYGVQAASQNYFRKNVSDLNLAEIALLAGLPQAPSRYSPFRHPERARSRREYVLRRMLEEGSITPEELTEAKETPIVVYPALDVSRSVTPYFTEHVRRKLFEQFGEDTILDEGLTVFTTVDVERYRAAEDAVYTKLRMVDKRQGYRGPLTRLKGDAEIARFLTAYNDELKYLDRFTKLVDGELYLGVVVRVDRRRRALRLKVGPHDAVLPLAAMRWARKIDPQIRFDRGLLDQLPRSLKKGDVLLVRTTTLERIKDDRYAKQFISYLPTDPTVLLVALEQEPNLETAVLSEDVRSGYVHAMIGGYSFDRSEFNRALQACRQPGSSFKPIVYSAALALKGWTPATTVLDAPVTHNDPKAQKRWKPGNFGGKFQGDVTLRMALQKSMNAPAIRILQAVGVRKTIEYARRLGIKSELRSEMGLALGSSCVTMGELLDVYRVFANYGRRVGRRFITRVLDRNGDVLFDQGWPLDPWAGMQEKVARAVVETSTPEPQVIDRATGFLTTKLMRNVVADGTGAGAKSVNVPVAGKTGTTNDSFDAWFVGYTTEILTAAWVGYDDYVIPMGRYEQGGRAALPVWVEYMKKAIKKKTGEFEPPEDIVFVRIDPKTGKRARPDTLGAVQEAFREGTEPTQFVARADEANPDAFFLIDN